MTTNVVEMLKKYFVENSSDDNTILILRHDGIILYSNKEKMAQTGALLVGAWSALDSLLADKSSGEFRLGFDNSSSGIYALPLLISGEQHYLVCLYFKRKNPGFIKYELRKMADKICKHLLEKTAGPEVPFDDKDYQENKELNSEKTGFSVMKKNEDDRKSYLFYDVTDDEISRLFSSVGC